MRITLESGTPAELEQPEGEARRGLVIAADIMGLRELFDDLVLRLAEDHGWAVCAVEPFPDREHLGRDERLAAMRTLSDTRQVGDLVAAADALAVEPVAVMGFCMGGMYALKAAATGRFDRVCSFYGMIRIPEGWRGGDQVEPLDALARAPSCPVIAIIGTADPFTPPADVAALEAAGASVVRYEGAEHGFVHDPDRPAHRPGDAADAWQRVIAFLEGSRAGGLSGSGG